MRHQATLALAIRTVVVTTVASVRSHTKVGDREQARAAAARGLALLESLRIDRDISPDGEDGRLYAEALHHLQTLAKTQEDPPPGGSA